MIRISQSPELEICDPFDAHMIQVGPPALFTVDARNRLRMDSNRTRICWEELDAVPARKICHVLLRDSSTGWVQYALITAPELVGTLEAQLYPSQQDALNALSEMGAMPIGELPTL